jgi:hypothetical protein
MAHLEGPKGAEWGYYTAAALARVCVSFHPLSTPIADAPAPTSTRWWMPKGRLMDSRIMRSQG